MKKIKWAIGVDLGGTKIEAAHIDEEGNIQNREREKTDVSHGAEAIKKQIVTLAKKLIQKSENPPVCLGIGVAGQIQEETGMVTYAPNLNWEDVPLGADLQDQLGLQVKVLNDVRAATWGEWIHGAGKGSHDMICIFVGTGIGGGIVSGGTMLEGASNAAGEIGHMTISLDGPECHCGNKGCLEALAGSWAIARDAKKAISKHPKKSSTILDLADGDIDAIQAKTVIKAFKKNDKEARKLIKKVVKALAAGLAGVTNALNPERIIMGGGVIEHLPDLIPMVEKELRKRALEAALSPLEIVPAQLHDDSGVVGAAAVILKKNS